MGIKLIVLGVLIFIMSIVLDIDFSLGFFDPIASIGGAIAGVGIMDLYKEWKTKT